MRDHLGSVFWGGGKSSYFGVSAQKYELLCCHQACSETLLNQFLGVVGGRRFAMFLGKAVESCAPKEIV